jgi:3-hydroxyacyl-CoA dehydrogenase
MTETEPATRAVTDGIAVASIANPPVDALSAAVRAGLLDAVRRAAADPGVDGVVVAVQGKTFIAGAEIAGP